MEVNQDDVNFMYGIAEAVKKLRPGCEFELTDRTFTQWWHPDKLPPPEWEDVIRVFEEDKAKYESLEYAINRAATYPKIEQQLDMIWHSMNNDEIPGKGSNWFNTIKDVKLKYPKP